MNQHPSTPEPDGALARRIAVILRVGTVVAAALLSGGAVLSAFGAQQLGTVLLIAGCATLVLLPVARLLLMADHFARTDKLFLWVSLAVLALVIAGAAVGLLVHAPLTPPL